jgi:hypothetical protein
MGRKYSTHGEKKCVDNFWDKNLKNKDHPESQGVDEKDNIKVNLEGTEPDLPEPDTI